MQKEAFYKFSFALMPAEDRYLETFFTVLLAVEDAQGMSEIFPILSYLVMKL